MFKKLANRLNKKITDGEIITVNLDEVLFKIDFKTKSITEFKGEDTTGLSWTEEETSLASKIRKRGYRPKKDGYIEVTKDMVCIDGIHKAIAINYKSNPKIKVKRTYSTWGQSLRYAILLKILGH
jgi:hypothetical protein